VTVRESADALREARTIVGIAEYDDYLDEAFCPFCRSIVTDNVGTPTVPTSMLEDDLEADRLPVFGWRCDCRRAEVAVAARAEIAPDGYGTVELATDDGSTTIAVPEPALDAAQSVEVTFDGY